MELSVQEHANSANPPGALSRAQRHEFGGFLEEGEGLHNVIVLDRMAFVLEGPRLRGEPIDGLALVAGAAGYGLNTVAVDIGNVNDKGSGFHETK